jgi:DNA-binding transcriptional regulator of glucitol operon
MAIVRERWLSKRAVSLHVAVLVFVPGCAVAAWWQINRAESGNQLSYLYSVMWPVFGMLGLYFWWMLLHTDYDTVGLKGMRRQQEAAAGGDPGTVAAAGPDTDAQQAPAPAPAAAFAVEDPELAAYNARLAELASKGPKTWRAREKVVVRRER